MRPTQIVAPTRPNRCGTGWRRTVILGVLLLSWSFPLEAQLAPCSGNRDVADALTRIEESIDPCGESSQIARVLNELKRCSANVYRVCVDPNADRNYFDRPIETDGAMPRTITWNP